MEKVKCCIKMDIIENYAEKNETYEGCVRSYIHAKHLNYLNKVLSVSTFVVDKQQSKLSETAEIVGYN